MRNTERERRTALGVIEALATTAGAEWLFYARSTGLIPAADGLSWGQMPYTTSMVAISGATPVESSSWSSLKGAYRE